MRSFATHLGWHRDAPGGHTLGTMPDRLTSDVRGHSPITGAEARLLARLALARVRLLDATTLRDRRAKELRELIDLAHDVTSSTTYREGS